MDRKIILLIFLIGLSQLFCSGEQNPSSARKAGSFPDQVVENTTMVFTHNGVKSAEIKIKYLEKYEKKDLAKGKVIYADIYDQEGKHISSIKADSGWIREKREEIKVFGNVVVKSDEGVVLETQSLSWNPQSSKVTTDDFVKITKGKDVITGYGLEADHELNELKIKKEVKGKIKDMPEEEIGR